MMADLDTPYADAFAHYWDNGWRGILPLPVAQKYPPPNGYTGATGDWPSYADCQTWADQSPDANLALRLPDTIIGLDVDNYGDKTGGDTLADLVQECGPLPATWLSTSRGDGVSGIRLYAVPAGTRLITALPGVELIQHHHRYTVAWPSIHPKTGDRYQWLNEQTGEVGDLPHAHNIPPLPQAWVTRLETTSQPATKNPDIDPEPIINQFPAGDACHHIRTAAGKVLTSPGQTRHDTYMHATLAIAGHARRGCPGGRETLTTLRDLFVRSISDRATAVEATAEYGSLITGAIKIVANEPPGTRCVDDLSWIPNQPEPGDNTDTSSGTGAGILEYAVNWDDLLTGEPPEPDWLVDGLIEQGRLIAIYSAAKAGKSLLTLDIAACIALGKPCLGTPAGRPRHVLYIDLEMTPTEVADRIRNYGHNNIPGLTTHLHYLSLPMLPPLDSPEGGKAVVDAAQACGAELVIIDTTSRTIQGGENDSDTWHAWYRNTGLPLKSMGCTVIRLDHSGKDKDKGQRGSSAKVSDVDLVLKLTRPTDTEIVLKREEARQAHYLDRVSIQVVEDVLPGGYVLTRHAVRHDVFTDGEALDLAARVNEAGLPPGAGWRPILEWARANGYHKVTQKQAKTAARIRKNGATQ